MRKFLISLFFSSVLFSSIISGYAADTLLEKAPAESHIREVPASSEVQPPDSKLLPSGNISAETGIAPAQEEPYPEEWTDGVELFADLSFPRALTTAGAWILSDFESIRFSKDAVTADLHGNHVVLNIQNQIMTNETLTGYRVEPITPLNDYLDIYFDNLEAMEVLAKKAEAQQSALAIKNPSFAKALVEAREILSDFHRRVLTVKHRSQEEDKFLGFIEAIREHHDGELPSFQDLKWQSKGNKNEEIWEAQMLLDPEENQRASSRVYELRQVKSKWRVTRLQLLNADGRAFEDEKWDYDRDGDLQGYIFAQFSSDGVKQSEKETRYASGVIQGRYLEEFDVSGRRSRLVREAFYGDGTLKSTADLDYLKGQQYIYRFAADGRALSSTLEPLSEPSVS